MGADKPAQLMRLCSLHFNQPVAACALFLIGALTLTSCQREASVSEDFPAPASSELSNAISTVSTGLIPQSEFAPLLNQLLSSLYSDFDLLTARYQQFLTSVTKMLDDPSRINLEESRTQWLIALNSYERTAFTRYLLRVAAQGTAVEQSLALQLDNLEYLINNWPIQPGYLDYLPSYPQSGVVNDTTLPLNELSIRDQHGKFDIAESTLGFHVIEFLLWGSANALNQNGSTPQSSANNFLTRPFEDFLNVGPALGINVLDENATRTNATPENTEQTPYQNNNPRRREFLQLTMKLLQQDLNELVSLREQYFPFLRERFRSTSAETTLLILINSASALLSEEVLIRSLYPLLNGDYNGGMQSLFSRSTQQATISQLSGIEDLFLTLRTENGFGIEEAISSLDAEFGDRFSDDFLRDFDASKECLTRLYASLHTTRRPQPVSADDAAAAQQNIDNDAEIVACINVVNNMVNSLDLVKQGLMSPPNIQSEVSDDIAEED